MPDVTTHAVIECGVSNGDHVHVCHHVFDMRNWCLAHRHLLVRNLVLRFSCIVGACPTTVRSQDVGTHSRGEALEVRGNLVMEEEVPGLVLEIQSRRNTVALCVVTDHVQKHVYKERGVAGHLRKT